MDNDASVSSPTKSPRLPPRAFVCPRGYCCVGANSRDTSRMTEVTQVGGNVGCLGKHAATAGNGAKRNRQTSICGSAS